MERKISESKVLTKATDRLGKKQIRYTRYARILKIGIDVDKTFKENFSEGDYVLTEDVDTNWMHLDNEGEPVINEFTDMTVIHPSQEDKKFGDIHTAIVPSRKILFSIDE